MKAAFKALCGAWGSQETLKTELEVAKFVGKYENVDLLRLWSM